MPDADPSAFSAEEQRLWTAFNAFDMDGSGTIELPELRDCLRLLGVDVSEQDLRRIFEAVDTDGTGTIDFGCVAPAASASIIVSMAA